jgi:hypothetical protein
MTSAASHRDVRRCVLRQYGPVVALTRAITALNSACLFRFQLPISRLTPKFGAFNIGRLFNRPRVFSLARQSAAGQNHRGGYDPEPLVRKAQLYCQRSRTEALAYENAGHIEQERDRIYSAKKTKGQHIRRPKARKIQIIAPEWGASINWLEYKTNPIDEFATLNTGRVIRDVVADILRAPNNRWVRSRSATRRAIAGKRSRPYSREKISG